MRGWRAPGGAAVRPATRWGACPPGGAGWGWRLGLSLALHGALLLAWLPPRAAAPPGRAPAVAELVWAEAAQGDPEPLGATEAGPRPTPSEPLPAAMAMDPSPPDAAPALPAVPEPSPAAIPAEPPPPDAAPAPPAAAPPPRPAPPSRAVRVAAAAPPARGDAGGGHAGRIAQAGWPPPSAAGRVGARAGGGTPGQDHASGRRSEPGAGTAGEAPPMPESAPAALLPDAYRAALAARLRQSLRYPPSARDRDEEGDAVVAFRVARDGTIRGARLVRSSGVTALDQEALALLARVSPAPALPEGWPAAEAAFVIPVRFQLR